VRRVLRRSMLIPQMRCLWRNRAFLGPLRLAHTLQHFSCLAVGKVYVLGCLPGWLSHLSSEPDSFDKVWCLYRSRSQSCTLSGGEMILIFDGGSRPAIPSAWKESRPWLQPRVRPAPQKRRRKPLGVPEFWHHIRTCLRAWWIWLGIAMLLLRTGIWLGALLAGCGAFLFYYTSPHSHSAVYPLEPDLLTASDEFSGHSGRHDGHATGLR
jgi:hypothetical protein